MKNLKDREDDSWHEEPVTMYAFFPELDDEMLLSDERKRSIVRLVKWLLQSIEINTEQYLQLIKQDELPVGKNSNKKNEK